MKKITVGMLGLTAALLLTTGCSKSDVKETQKETTKETKAPVKETEAEVKTSETKIEMTETDEKEVKDDSDNDFSELVSMVKTNMDAEEGTALFDGKELEVKQGDLSLEIDGYELVEVTDFNQDFAIPFGRQTERGGILLVKYTLENKGAKEVFYPLTPDFTYTTASKTYKDDNSLIPEDNADYANLTSKLVSVKGKVESGKEVEGYSAIPLDPEALDKVLELGEITMDVPPVFGKEGSVSSEDKVADSTKLRLELGAKGKQKIANSEKFIEDKATKDNMGEKTLIDGKSGLSEADEKNDIKVTLTDYQFTDFKPNEAEAGRFTSFDKGVVLLSLAFDIENKGNATVATSMSGSSLSVNDGKARFINEGLLTSLKEAEDVKKGETKKFIQVFTMDKEEYDKLLKDKDYKIEVRLSDDKGETMAKGKRFEIVIPTK